MEAIARGSSGSRCMLVRSIAFRRSQQLKSKRHGRRRNVASCGKQGKHMATSVPSPIPQSRLPGNSYTAKPAEAGLDAQVMKDVDEELHAKVDRGEAPGVVSLVYRHGVLAHLDCYGYADLERKLPIRPDSIVRLYSMTKCIVSAGVAVCLEDGSLQLDDHLSKFIPAFANPMVKAEDDDELTPAERPITLLHLLTHTSGIGYGPMLGDEAAGEEERFTPLIKRAGLGRSNPKDPDSVLTIADWCDEIAKIPLRSQPGKEWYYSYSFDIVGRVLEIVTGERLDRFLRRRILEPLQMVDTSFEVPHEKWDRVAGIYRREEEETTYRLDRIDSAEITKNEWMVGNASPILSGGGCIDQYSGGLVSTATDFARFCMMLRNKGELDGVRILKDETVERFTRNMLPAATGSEAVWAFNSPGVGFCLLGSVSVDHPELDPALRPKEYGWGGMAGTAWTNDPDEDFFLLSFSMVAFDLTTEEELRAGVRKAIASAARKKEKLARLGAKSVAAVASPAKLRRPSTDLPASDEKLSRSAKEVSEDCAVGVLKRKLDGELRIQAPEAMEEPNSKKLMGMVANTMCTTA